MNFLLDWDDAAFILACIRKVPGRRAARLRNSILDAMREYDAQSTSAKVVRMTKDIRERVACWEERLARRRCNPRRNNI